MSYHLFTKILATDLLSSNFGFPNRVMWVSVLVSDCHPELEKPKLDDNIIATAKHQNLHVVTGDSVFEKYGIDVIY